MSKANKLVYSSASICEGINFDQDLLSSPSPTLKRALSRVEETPPSDHTVDFDPDAVIPDTPPLSPTPIPQTSHFVGFTTGNGKSIAAPSENGFKKAAMLFNDAPADLSITHNTRVEALDNLTRNYKYEDNSPSTPESVDKEGMVNHSMQSNQSSLPSDLGNHPPPAQPEFVGFTTAAGAPVPMPSQQSLDKAREKFVDTTNDQSYQVNQNSNVQNQQTQQQIANTQQPIPKTTIPSTLQNKQINSPLPFNKPLLKTQTTPFKSPLLNSNRKLDTVATPKPFRPRLSFGATSNKPNKRQRFVTPFKEGVVPSSEPGETSTASLKSSTTSNTLKSTNRVFDLKYPGERKKFADYGVRPSAYTVAYLKAVNIPQSIIQMNPQLAQGFVFENGFNAALAYEEMKKRGCTYITMRWVKNHWRFIIWKLSAIIRSCPTELTRWTSEEVVRQLLYRYEREHNLAERSCIKRIQEHDSSSTRPMVLCVSGIISNNIIELTDGWYPIHAQIDECLSRALSRRRIKLGCKISIIGARLLSGYEGTDVLDAVGTCNLSITANSTSLTRWDEKLGFQPPLTGFVSTIGSLSFDGGLISLLDVVITKIFPLAYIDSEQRANDHAWDEVEEMKRLQEEQNRINLESESDSHKRMKEIKYIEDILMRLDDATSNIATSRNNPDEIDADDELDTIIAITDPKERNKRIRSLNRSIAVNIAISARERMMKIAKQPNENKAERRKVRNFRVIRIEDYSNGIKAKKSAQLHIWDAVTLNTHLTEGQRFKITNCNPTRQKSWPSKGQSGEVYLSTRRNTRFYNVNNA
ncbi:hypothetical protein E3Q03_02140 [Wallemia mellicola]|uniref:BRCA2 OB1 domain-containing protein n=1 Tax=Wallemia mellicola TaxID=1708541 RepID=A0AB74KEC2_9BASI|nr:hypothetical protein E3Q03_02140 [Wallemia mellicola]